MSLWTPGGEHEVPRESEPGAGPSMPGPALDDLTPEEEEQARQMAEEMMEVRRQLASVPAAMVVANHVMGFYELAAIHLSKEPPDLREAQVAIDAMAAVVENLPGRLGEHEQTLKDALGQIRLAYIQVRGAVESRGRDESSTDT